MNFRSKRTRVACAGDDVNVGDGIEVKDGEVNSGTKKTKDKFNAKNPFFDPLKTTPITASSKNSTSSYQEQHSLSSKIAPKFGPFNPSTFSTPSVPNNVPKKATTFIPSLTSQSSKDALKASLSKPTQMIDNNGQGDRLANLQEQSQLHENEGGTCLLPNRNTTGKFQHNETERGTSQPHGNKGGHSLSILNSGGNSGGNIQQTEKEQGAYQPYEHSEGNGLVRQKDKESVQQMVDPNRIGSFSEGSSEEIESEDDVEENVVQMDKEIPLRPKTKKKIYRPQVKINWSDEILHDPDEEVVIEEVIKDQGIRQGTMSGTILASHVWLLPFERKIIVPFNELNQPIRKGGVVLVHFLSDLAKSGDYCPIGETSWKKVDKHFKLEIINLVRAWKQYRHDLKSLYYKSNLTKEQMINGERPSGVILEQWVKLVSYWCSDKAKKLAKLGMEARASQVHAHTTGSRSMAQWKIEFEKIHKRKPRSNLEFWKFTHVTQDGGYIGNTDTQDFMSHAEEEVSKRVANSKGQTLPEIEDQVFHDLIYSNDNSNHVVGYGFGVTKNQVFGLESELQKRYGSHNVSSEIQGIKEHLVSLEKNHNEIVSTLEKKNVELEKRNEVLVKQNEEILGFLNLIVKKLDHSNAGQ